MTLSRRRILLRTNRFGRDIRTLPKDIQEDAYRIALKLCDNVFDQELDVKPLTGFKGYYRVIVASDYRMIFSFDDNNIYLLRIAHRNNIYRKLEL